MKKNTACLLLVCIFVFTSFMSSTNYLEVDKTIKIENEIVMGCGCNDFIAGDGDDDLLNYYVTMDETTCEFVLTGSSSKPNIVDTPSYFNWADLNGTDWTTPAKHQGNCGSCWVFAPFGALESIIKIREKNPDLNPDLSEQYMLSCFDKAGSCHGGNAYFALKLINDTSAEGNYHNGVLPESCLVYQADDSLPCSIKCDDWVEKLVPISDFGYWYPNGSITDRDAIKSQVFEKGPVATHIFATNLLTSWGAKHHSPDDYYSFYWPMFTINHVVMIVGWKDDESIRNGGYWICKNSWGEHWGYNGFFNIEYGCLNVDNMFIVYVDYNPDSFYWSPVANAGGPYGNLVNQTVTFNASKSIGVENDIVSYLWDFGDGTFGEGKLVDHVYNKVGSYIVKLKVKDTKNIVDSDITYALIQSENRAPDKPNISGPSSINVNRTYQYGFFTVDPEENEVYYKINWGDEKETGWLGPYHSGKTILVNHTWMKNQPCINITVKSKDIFGDESSESNFDVKTKKSSVDKSRINKFNLFEVFTRVMEFIKFILYNCINM